MSLLFIQTWDIIHGREEDYNQHLNDVYLPEMSAVGFVAVGGYYVEVGMGPRIIVVFSSESLGDISRIITSGEFKELTAGLKQHVCNYRNTVIEPTGTVKRGRYTVQKGVWKFNQYYDLLPGMKNVYADFVINEHIPAMLKIDYLEVTSGWNVVLGGFCEIIAEFTFKDPEDIGRLLRNEDFRRATTKLRKTLVTNYTSRVLRSMELFEEPKWFKL